ncbi:hypothetical protein ABIE09_003557 [Lysobacter enzymogenes]|uniref:Integron gene cassette protein n=1 Tax=Lysobacter enzymogenes TaxID=69 RepID=A0AAU9AIZ8_LYSEN|nr:hypothetical protein [Lysobacter enzymogenes]BAV95660.1 integron gene cassette protein [Lysobacter enzymogenes]SDX99374.1 hypothetical protein SAMN05421681_109285 [Lysobacter enzymogenes]
MDPISLEDLALLDVLQRIDHGHAPDDHSRTLRERLIESALAHADEDGTLALTDAGVERCKSLRHRMAADAEAAQVLKDREEAAQETEAP